MSALSQATDTVSLSTGGETIPQVQSYPVAPAAVLYTGGMAQLADGTGTGTNAAANKGYVVPAGTGGQGAVVGVMRNNTATPMLNGSTFTPGSVTGNLTGNPLGGPVAVEVDVGGHLFDMDTAFTQSNVGSTVYAVDDHTVSLSNAGSTRGKAGVLIGLKFQTSPSVNLTTPIKAKVVVGLGLVGTSA